MKSSAKIRYQEDLQIVKIHIVIILVLKIQSFIKYLKLPYNLLPYKFSQVCLQYHHETEIKYMLCCYF